MSSEPQGTAGGGSGDHSGVRIAQISAFQAIAVGVLTLLGTGVSGFTGYLIAKQNNKPTTAAAVTVVPPNAGVKKVPELSEVSDEGFQTLRDISVFDLRGWKQVPPSETNTRVSPANYINYLHVKKTRAAKTYRAHYATSGSGIDLRCITHTADVLQESEPKEHAGGKVKEYEVAVNVEDVPLDKEFLIVIEGTYWNSFQSLAEESASTYTDKDIGQLDELALFILLPENKPFKGYRLWSENTNGSNRGEYRGENKVYADRDGRFLYWTISERKPDHHYQVTWTW
jgi:hypothetical protein